MNLLRNHISLAVAITIFAAQDAHSVSHDGITSSPFFKIHASRKLRRGGIPSDHSFIPLSKPFSRRLPKSSSGGSSGGGGGGGSGSHDYIGCLAYSDSQLSKLWPFPGNAPACEYTQHPNGSGNGSDGGGGGSSGGGSGGSDGSSGGGNGGSNGSSGGGNGGSNGSNGGGGGSSGGSGGSGGSNGNDGNSDGSNGNGGNSGGDDNGDGNNDIDSGNGDGNNDNNPQEDNGGGGNSNEDNGSNGGDQVVDNNDFDNSYEDDEDNSGGNGNQGDQDNGYQEDGVQGNTDENSDENSFDPYDDFDISQCDTYENLWLWDIALTCESAESLENCQCVFAEELLSLGIISCEDSSSCPEQCQICTSCMQLLGCIDSGTISNNPIGENSNAYVYALVAAGGLILVSGVFYMRQRRTNNADLNATLIGNEPHQDPDVPPVQPPVWLAPDSPPAQFEPSVRASLGEDPLLATNATGENVWLAPIS